MKARTSCLQAPHSLCPPSKCLGEQWVGAFAICRAGRWVRGRSFLPLDGANRALAPALDMAVWQQDENLASLGCLLPAWAGPSLLHAVSRPLSTLCSLLPSPPLWPESGLLGIVHLGEGSLIWSWGRKLPGRTQGRFDGASHSGWQRSWGSPISPTCHATENQEGNERL